MAWSSFKKADIQSDNAEENLKSKLESLIDQGPSNVNISHEATDVICPSVPDVCVSIDELSVSQFANLKADFASYRYYKQSVIGC